MTQKQSQNLGSNGSTIPQPPHPEVVPQAQRRIFTARYKLWVLEEADKCREQPGRIGVLLRREGLYSSHLTTWRRQREAGQLVGLTPQKRGRKVDEEAVEMRRLRQEIQRLEGQVAQAELIIEAQRKRPSQMAAISLGRVAAESEETGSSRFV